MNPRTAPPKTSMIGWGTERYRAKTVKLATTTSSPAISISASFIGCASSPRSRSGIDRLEDGTFVSGTRPDDQRDHECESEHHRSGGESGSHSVGEQIKPLQRAR